MDEREIATFKEFDGRLHYNKYMLNVLTDPHQFKTIVFHRRAGKTVMSINELCRWAESVVGVYWYIGPNVPSVKNVVWNNPSLITLLTSNYNSPAEHKTYLPPDVWENRNNTDRILTFPNGSKIIFYGSESKLAGSQPNGVVIDESQDVEKLRELIDRTLMPMGSRNPNFWLWVIGTFNGKNDFYDYYTMATQEKSKDKARWTSFILKASESGLLDEDYLKDMKKTTTEAFYNQEYECLATDNSASVFKNTDACIDRSENKWYNVDKRDRHNYQFQVGIDLARYNDYTVITVFCLNNFRVQEIKRFNQTDWSTQRDMIVRTYNDYAMPKLVMDASGSGQALVEDISKVCEVDAIKFTEQERTHLLGNLAVLLEHKRIKIPNDENLINELNAFQYKIVNGKLKMMAPSRVHDDCVMSLALAVRDIPPRPLETRIERRQRRDSTALKNSLRGNNEGIFTGSAYLNKNWNRN